ncbi:hypothetical protein CWE09_13405 [Aliidiomarina minuta]|uniref:N-acetyltransferase domain-containing protein n=1 Tax=Aliidiomarina minuta TaxID=880057 RepID=A0A432W123_9GAMM|nr:GNAT family N-acetyltransferase [Aliidiomarina minuta]RUO22925.1 hypothetical protein CWE09_13405 [Aliidiomarina minuta]
MNNQILPALGSLLKQAAKTQQRGLLLVEGLQQACNWPSFCLHFGEQSSALDLNQYRQYLGSTNLVLVIDCRHQVHADAIAALSGSIIGGGALVLLLPASPCPFLHRLINKRPKQLCNYLKDPEPGEFPENFALPPMHAAVQLTAEQAQVLRQLSTHLTIPQPALIIAARGRGKSTLLGFLAARSKAKVWVCAPARRQVETLMLHARNEGATPSFIAPDALLQSDQVQPKDTLILDEAASLPRHMLDAIIERFPQVKMATTTEGYEGCGRGFALQFMQHLKQTFSQFLSFELQQPQRWAAGCPLETWLQRALLLPSHNDISPTPFNGPVSYQQAHASELNEEQLKQCFKLLLNAHYQSSPNDLKLLLDDPNQSLLLQWQADNLLGVAWLSHEGHLTGSLADAVYSGRRRPPGNLLGQSLCYHLRDKDAAASPLLRVVRIAVEPTQQQQGFGSKLLNQCVTYAREQSYAALGSSFGLSPKLLHFWKNAGFLPVRIGSKPDMASGRYSGLLLLPLNPLWITKVERWQCYFLAELNWHLLRTPLSAELVRTLLPLTQRYVLDKVDAQLRLQQMLSAFAKAHLPFDLVQPALSAYINLTSEAPELLKDALYRPLPLSQVAKQHGLHGRKDCVKELRQICVTLPPQL